MKKFAFWSLVVGAIALPSVVGVIAVIIDHPQALADLLRVLHLNG